MERRLAKWQAQLLGSIRHLSAHPRLACIVIGLFCLFGRLILLPVRPIPLPSVHDEFSYLLAGDTFAHGRLTNPAHPLWVHFESFHVLQQPTYASKYPPLQGMVLALGQLLGHPWIGVWLSAGVMCIAVTWMLQGWLPSRLSLIIGFVFALKIGIPSYWMNSYWGGAVQATGGAILLGSFFRLWRKPYMRLSVLFGMGGAILLNSRPFEGALLGVPAFLFLVVRWRKQPLPFLRRCVTPVLIILALTASWMAYYNWRVTGNPLLLPYEAHERQYAVVTAFTWQKMRPVPVYHHRIMQQYWQDFETALLRTARVMPAMSALFKLYIEFEFYVGYWPLAVPFLASLLWWRARKARIAFVLAACTAAGFAGERLPLPHYIAPASGLFFLFFGYGLLALRRWRPAGYPYGRILAVTFVVLAVFSGLSSIYTEKAPAGTFGERRANLLNKLEAMPGKHLVLVRYGAQHDIHTEWVYNAADIDASRVVWAREMSQVEDQPLIRYYRDRRIWRLEPDHEQPLLLPYPAATSGAADSAISDGGR